MGRSPPCTLYHPPLLLLLLLALLPAAAAASAEHERRRLPRTRIGPSPGGFETIVSEGGVATPGRLIKPLGLTATNMNPRVVAAEYAVRGRLLDRAMEIEKDGREVVRCNIGNPQALGQIPLRWIRQVLVLVLNTELLEAVEKDKASGTPGELSRLFEVDAVARARKYLGAVRSVGAYSDSQGVPVVREEVASFLAQRDGCPCDPADVFLTDGASAGVRTLLQCLLGEQGVDAILAPSPVYPLYSALSTLMQGATALYPLHENYETGVWTIRLEDLERSLVEVCVCVCVCERERERERIETVACRGVNVCVCVRACACGRLSESVCGVGR